MLDIRAVDSIGKHLVAKNARFVADVENLTDDRAGELGVALDGDVLLWRVEALDGAEVGVGKRLSAGRVGGDNVSVHLMDALVPR